MTNLYFLGPEGSYCSQAARIFEEFLPDKPVFQSCRSIISVLKNVDKDENSFAVLPFENSYEGTVRETADNIICLKDDNLKICAEKTLPVHHCLAAKTNNKEDITKIYSYTQALRQCEKFLEKNFKNVEIHNTTSTSEAAKSLRDNNSAAIVSEYCAKIYNLNVLAKQINDFADNKTRFVLLGRRQTIPSGKDKTGIMFEVENKPGSLVRVLNVFDKNNVNLLLIESRPSKKKSGEYIFFADLEGHITDNKIEKSLSEIKNIVQILKITGSYPF